MLLKDRIFNILKKEKNVNDKIKKPVMDGFVDIKGYDKSGKLFYHDCGDNVVTDWMRHAILQLLAGISYVKNGDQPISYENGARDTNPDAYVFSGYQYDSNGGSEAVGAAVTKRSKSNVKEQQYAVFPTKILLGTGKEYKNWEILKSENENTNSVWFEELIKTFGDNEETAKANFNKDIESINNILSGSLGNGVYSGTGAIQQMRTVNDPSSSTNDTFSAVSMYRNYNVVGAVKTPYFSTGATSEKIASVISESGRLLNPNFRGIGRPAFIYFNQLAAENNGIVESDIWETNGDIVLSKETTDNFLTKLTFSFTLPQQSSATGAFGKYYPYNGWQIKQIGLYNDAKLVVKSSGENDEVSKIVSDNMPYGTLLAVKNIAPFIKTADTTFKITWTLTI